MPSVKTKFEVDRDGKPIRCPKNEKELRRLPECGIFDYNILPFRPINPGPQPYVPPYVPPHPPPPHPQPSPFQPRQMPGLPDMFDPQQVPNTPGAPDPRFPKAELLPEDPNVTAYYRYRRLKQDDTIASVSYTHLTLPTNREV